MPKSATKLICLLLIVAIVTIGLVSCGESEESLETDSRRYIDVTNYGADGADSSDDSVAFNAAVSVSLEKDIPVYVPLGTYYISDSLKIDSSAMIGQSENNNFPVIYNKSTENPLFQLSNGGAIRNIEINSAYDAANWDKVKLGSKVNAPAEITVSGYGCQIVNVIVNNAYIGIQAGSMTDREINSGRFYFDNIKINQPFFAGMYVCGARNFSWIKNCVIMCPETPAAQGFWLADADGLMMDNNRVFDANCGYHIHSVAVDKQKNKGGCSATISNCSAQLCDLGMRVGIGSHNVTVSECEMNCRKNALQIDASTDKKTVLSAYKCDFLSESGSTVVLSGGKSVTVSENTITNTVSPAAAALVVNGGSAVNVSQNKIFAAGVGIQTSIYAECTCGITSNQIITKGTEGYKSTVKNPSEKNDANKIQTGQTVEVRKAREASNFSRELEEEYVAEPFTDNVTHVDPTKFGANGQDDNDDSDCINNSIEIAKEQGMDVFIPAGRYIISKPINVNGVNIVGYDSKSWTSDSAEMPTFVHVVYDTPAFILENSGCLSGVCIESSYKDDFYNDETNSSLNDVSPEIVVSGRDSHISDIKIVNPYMGISAGTSDGEKTVTNIDISRVMVVSPKYCGIYVGGTTEDSLITDCEILNNGSKRCLYGFWLGENKQLNLTGLAVNGAKKGFYFGNLDGQKYAGVVKNCCTESCDTSVYSGGGMHNIIIQCSILRSLNEGVLISEYENSQSLFQIINCSVISEKKNCIGIQNGKQTTVQCSDIISGSMTDGGIKIEKSEGVKITECTVMSIIYPIELVDTNSSHKATVTGNLLYTYQKNTANVSPGMVLAKSATADITQQSKETISQ